MRGINLRGKDTEVTILILTLIVLSAKGKTHHIEFL